ncbi:MAG: copper amine oxidase N-terminal domain-containing protein [Bacillota bacterium]
MKKSSSNANFTRYFSGISCRCQAVKFCCTGLLLFIFIFISSLSLLYASSSPSNIAAEGKGEGKLRVYLEGVPLQPDIQPLLRGDRFYLPLRVMAEQAGFTVNWENGLKRATLYGAGREIALYPANPLYAVNGILHRTVQPPLLQGGRIHVGLDFLEKAAGLVLQDGDPERGFLQFKIRQQHLSPDREGLPHGAAAREQPVYFVELLLPPGDRVAAKENFEMRLAAPFVRGIYAYEISFFYNPSIIQVKDVHNPAYQPSREFYMKEINNREGKMRYTLTTLGYQEELPPRATLAVIEAVVSREGAVPLIQGTLVVTLLDHKARTMPVGLEERILTVGPAMQQP